VSDDEMREHLVKADRSLESLGDVHPATGHDVLYAYLAIDDAAAVAQRAVEADFDGHESFWTVASDTTVDVPTHELVDAEYSSATVRRPMDEYESLVDCSKAETMLGWTPERSWRDL